jgi:hypothetical protein
MTSPDIARDKKAKDIYRKKMDAARAVGYRESLLMQLNAVVLNWPKDHGAGGVVGAGGLKTKSALPEAARLLRNMSVDLREAGLRCVEKVRMEWRREKKKHHLLKT